eukprot:TRINITY_DN16635_c0_g1_i2.p1 TRINITY_DN16635_c0_g1~~TRINITY_DN16635_c0_g1_i2.p1  ORF type:complete len:190 (+),score=38.03 TRINITY_DN16635_c0_g1_i2:237-806(+)
MSRRVMVGQVSMGCASLFAVLVLRWLPKGEMLGLWCVVFFFKACIESWSFAAVTATLMSQIVPKDCSSLVFALNAGMAGFFSPVAAPIVGWVCEDVYGWDSSSFGSCDLGNAKALGNAMLVCSAIPYAVSALVYSGVYVTFPGDKARVLAESRVEREGDLPMDASVEDGNHRAQRVSTQDETEEWESAL